MGKIFLIIVTIAIPALGAVYALYKKRLIPFILGVLAFTISQMLIRVPLLNWLSENSSTYHVWNVTMPLLIIVLLAFSAGLFEEMARWLAMKFAMKQRDLNAGLAFGIGHGGIEALLIVGIPLLFAPNVMLNNADYFISGFERICAMIVHICLSLIVLAGVKKRKFVYVLASILLHGIVNFAVTSVAMISTIIIAELVMLIATVMLAVITYFVVRAQKT
ncbi:CAAX amino protease [Paenibacillus montaniterrae]|uniref:CAAX amino protease n=1 Tax=Paenibacillus montaniterrae TaxID=429341 RepID=A0A920CZX9_9BACL|nr:YhfC family glutamic-type intramembrane protease [Paenibacillus montaniterrae]GIP19221.1 CAAX amino protease [Paenibacillus montaniterrae]